MIVDEETLGLKKFKSKYVIENPLIKTEGLDIRLDKPLEILGDLKVRSIRSNVALYIRGNCIVRGNIFVITGYLKTDADLRACDVVVKDKLQIGGSVIVRDLKADSIKVNTNILVAGTLESVGDIQAECLSVKNEVFCGKAISVKNSVSVGKVIDVFDKIKADKYIKFDGDTIICKKLQAPKIIFTHAKYRSVSKNPVLLTEVSKYVGTLLYVDQ